MTTHRHQSTCRCDAYPFPHRWKGGSCHQPYRALSKADADYERRDTDEGGISHRDFYAGFAVNPFGR